MTRPTIPAVVLTVSVILSTVPGALPGASAAGFPTTDPADDARLVGGELVVYQLDNDDLDTLHPGSVLDRSPTESHGTIVGEPVRTDGVHGDAVTFRRNRDDAVVLDDLTGPRALAANFTVMAWLNLSAPNCCGDHVLVEAVAGTSTMLRLRLTWDHGIRLRLRDAAGTLRTYDPGLAIPSEGWHHVAVVANGGFIHWVLDGSTVHTDVRPDEIFDASTLTDVSIANEVGGSSDSLRGALDGFRIYDRSLANDEITDIADRPYFHPNAAPVADAGGDRTVSCTGPLTDVTLDGTGSSDPDGDPLWFLWSATSLHHETSIPIDDPTAPVTDAIFPVGTSRVDLVVSDGEFNATDTSDVTVLDGGAPAVTSVWPDAPGIYTGDQGVAGGDEIVVVRSVEVTAGAADQCSGVDKVVFTVDDGAQVVEDATAPYGFMFAPRGAGVQFHTIDVVAVDDHGNASPAETIDLTVVAGSV